MAHQSPACRPTDLTSRQLLCELSAGRPASHVGSHGGLEGWTRERSGRSSLAAYAPWSTFYGHRSSDSFQRLVRLPGFTEYRVRPAIQSTSSLVLANRRTCYLQCHASVHASARLQSQLVALSERRGGEGAFLNPGLHLRRERDDRRTIPQNADTLRPGRAPSTMRQWLKPAMLTFAVSRLRLSVSPSPSSSESAASKVGASDRIALARHARQDILPKRRAEPFSPSSRDETI